MRPTRDPHVYFCFSTRTHPRAPSRRSDRTLSVRCSPVTPPHFLPAPALTHKRLRVARFRWYLTPALLFFSPDAQIKKTAVWLKNSFWSHAKAHVSSADVARSMSTARSSAEARISSRVKL